VSTLLDNRSLYFASITDGLTGLFNRRFFDSRFGIECMRAMEKRAPLTLLLVDVDHFKKVNDKHGHQAGDAVLSMLGQAIKKRIRNSDFAARVGGEEFALLLPDTTPSDALIVAESLRKQVEDHPVAVPGIEKEIHVTVSCGIAGFRWTLDNQQAVFRMADEALYQAKQEGRNRTVTAKPPLD
jgi:two-component system cell cycle response regulator